MPGWLSKAGLPEGRIRELIEEQTKEEYHGKR
jgi:hypothetical protein